MRRLGPHIDGHAVEETGAGTSDTCGPSTGLSIATVTRAGVDEVDRAPLCGSPIQLVW